MQKLQKKNIKMANMTNEIRSAVSSLFIGQNGPPPEAEVAIVTESVCFKAIFVCNALIFYSE